MNKLKFNLINKYRNYLKRVLTNNMGKVEETEDKIMCYVDSKMLNDSGFLLIDCCDKKKELFPKIKKYNLNKPIIYIIDGINLNDNVDIHIWDNRSSIIIKNSSFKGVRIDNPSGSCLLENVKVNLDKDTWPFSSVSSKRLYINGLVVNKHIPNDFEISIYAPEKIKVNKLIILDSPKISLYCPKRLDVSSSIINGENVSFESNIMNIENTYINGEEYLGKDENNTPIGMNKKLEKVKSK